MKDKRHWQLGPWQAIPASISFHLPRLAREEATVSPPPAPGKSPAGTETVLLAEDEEKVRGVGPARLQANGYTVLEDRDGEEAVRVLHGHDGPVFLLVTDVVMPRMSGRQIAGQAASLHPGSEIL